jgi:predicted negative regulator of RcsB-dependent stress response
VEQYRTEEEQVEALGRWWKENGRSMVAAVVVALGGVFGWQAWQANELRQQEQASDLYQALLQAIGTQDETPGSQGATAPAEQLKSEFGSTTYAQFAALQLAALAVNEGKLPDAEAQLRWVLGKAEKGSDIAQVAQLRLARVLAASGATDQALAILAEAEPGAYGASYAAAKGDILLAAGRNDEARDAYSLAVASAAGSGGQGLNLSALQQKLQSLTPVPARTLGATVNPAPGAVDAASATNDTVDVPEE